MKTALSVIMITRNEERDLPASLESLKPLSPEIIVVDSGSTDRTLDIAKSYQAKTFQYDWSGYSRQKQFALDQAKSPWVLNIDADERVTPGLAAEIERILSFDDAEIPFDGFRIPFKNYFLGKKLNWGAGRQEKHLRLFRKKSAQFGDSPVHEGIQVSGKIGGLRSPIDHYSYHDLKEYLDKCNFYTTLISRQKYEKGDRFHVWQHLRLPYEFFVRYFLKLGFLDGEKGLLYAKLSSFYVWLKFMKLRDYEAKEGQR
jgi:glycosyltransferase involved in cell wall biosynthesis